MKKFISVLSVIIVLPIAAFYLFFFLSSFTDNLSKNEKNSNKLSKRSQIAIARTVKTAKILSETRNLRFDGFGGSGGMQGVVKMRAISLTSTDGPFNVKQARELVVYCAEVFLREINNSEEIRPYLYNYPFTAKNIEVAVFCHDKDDNSPPAPFIACASAYQGTINYKINVNEGYAFKTIHSEPYEEALKILKKDKKLKN
jgi:hypothetical protein